MKTIVKINEVISTLEGLEGIGSVPATNSQALIIAQNIRVLKMEANVLSARRRQLIDGFKGVRLVKLPEGGSIYVPFPPGWKDDEKNTAELVNMQARMNTEFNEMLSAFGNETIDIVIPGLQLADLPNGILGNDVEKCLWLIRGKNESTEES